ncbi:glycerol-3-phosphate dehydrogenase family protein [Aspergillus homomorphus CBS 101889]|uniref:Glycerol-3-phosphate dehydrogenase [NAD(+)] n=1 Tax=Aspergillus homomorphus (strain CBS 101889) TaxID=1450537 RepID=A0A395I6S9_ASPHC|nr:NAD-dependent glycerol-3-phosphate dehydrogenase [Aspergillus homomorphus CBS 101889]RAL15880.1 NAD-dependent glycerol-3-phosphate dehydrogenase [Aspergillus homomorphus CBS 101889]
MANHTRKHKVTVVGSGNWGSTIAKIIAENTKEHPDLFEQEVRMWVFEEEIEVPESSKHHSKLGGQKRKLTEVINEVHENVKYLPDIALPDNVVADPDLKSAVKDATLLVFNLPHQFIGKTLDGIAGNILPYARAISCIKGVDVSDGTVTLHSELIMERLGIYCGALSGANIAPEVAAEKFCETTIGYDVPPMDLKPPDGSKEKNMIKIDEQRQSKRKPTHVELTPVPQDLPHVGADLLEALFARPYFHVHHVHDVAGVALGGALKNIVALASGFVAGKGWGENSKAAIMRVGVLEMIKFGRTWFPKSVKEQTFTEESAGMADLVSSCSAGRNYRSACHAVEQGVSVQEIEEKELNGQKLQGTSTAYDVHEFLEKQGKLKEFPLFVAVHDILEGTAKVEDLPALIGRRKTIKA